MDCGQNNGRPVHVHCQTCLQEAYDFLWDKCAELGKEVTHASTMFVEEVEKHAKTQSKEIDLICELEKMRKELAAEQRKKYGTPCSCESWIAACRGLEEELAAYKAKAEALEQEIAEAENGEST